MTVTTDYTFGRSLSEAVAQCDVLLSIFTHSRPNSKEPQRWDTDRIKEGDQRVCQLVAAKLIAPDKRTSHGLCRWKPTEKGVIYLQHILSRELPTEWTQFYYPTGDEDTEIDEES